MRSDQDLLIGWCILKGFEIYFDTESLYIDPNNAVLNIKKQFSKNDSTFARVYDNHNRLIDTTFPYNQYEAIKILLQTSYGNQWGYMDKDEPWIMKYVKFPQNREELEILLDMNGIK